MRISGFGAKYKWFLCVVKRMIQKIASFFDSCFQEMASDEGVLGVIAACFFVTQVALLGFIPSIIGSVALGWLTGTAIAKVYIEHPEDMDHTVDTSDPVVETEIVPYDKWPDECYVCQDDISDNMNIRGQFVVHKGESDTKTKAVPLCEECTWSYSTLVDNHDTLVEIYDERDKPTEL